MIKNMWKKGLVLGIILLFVGSSVAPIIGGSNKEFEKTYCRQNETLDMKKNDYNNLIKQTIQSGVISNNDWF